MQASSCLFALQGVLNEHDFHALESQFWFFDKFVKLAMSYGWWIWGADHTLQF